MGLMALLLSAPLPAAPLRPSALGAALCDERGEGTHTERHVESKTIKARVVCRDTDRGAVVRYAWYFDELGRRTREEDFVPGNPAKSRIVDISYDLQSTEPSGTRTYDGQGKLVSSTNAKQEKAAAARGQGAVSVQAAYHEYITACEEDPGRMLHPLMGREKEPQFFTKSACTCVAQKAVRSDDAPPGKIWKTMRTLDRKKMTDRLTVAALQNLSECLCPEVFPESQLSRLCAHAGDIEKAWTPD